MIRLDGIEYDKVRQKLRKRSAERGCEREQRGGWRLSCATSAAPMDDLDDAVPVGIKGLRDEALRGQWDGHRSSRRNLQYRVIYRVESDRVCVEVVSVTAHDYRRKRRNE